MGRSRVRAGGAVRSDGVESRDGERLAVAGSCSFVSCRHDKDLGAWHNMRRARACDEASERVDGRGGDRTSGRTSPPVAAG